MLNIHPNPIVFSTKIEYNVYQDGLPVQLLIYNTHGEIVDELVKNHAHRAGYFSIQWEPTNFPDKEYFCKILIGDKTRTKTMRLIR